MKEEKTLIKLTTLTYQDGNLFGIFENIETNEKFAFEAKASNLNFSISETTAKNHNDAIVSVFRQGKIEILLDTSTNNQLFQIFSTKEIPHTLTKNQIEEILGYKIYIAAE